MTEAQTAQPQQQSATQTVEGLQNQLRDAMLEAHQLGEQLEGAKERVTMYRTALNGVQLGQKMVEEAGAGAASAGAGGSE